MLKKIMLRKKFMLKPPVLIVNFKTYEEGIGKKALILAKKIEKAAFETKVSVAIAVNASDIRMISKAIRIPVLAQHVDADKFGAHTGSIIPESVKNAGAVGTLINHTEKKLSDALIEKTIKRCKKLGLFTVLCADNVRDTKRLVTYKPDFIAVEPPELIGGKISVSIASPDIIKNSVKAAGKIPLLCGAGIHQGLDIKKALGFGSKGILISSGIVKAKNPYKASKELMYALR